MDRGEQNTLFRFFFSLEFAQETGNLPAFQPHGGSRVGCLVSEFHREQDI